MIMYSYIYSSLLNYIRVLEYFQRTTVVGCLVRSVKSCVQPTIVGIENVGSDGKGKEYPHVADLY